MRMTRIGLVTGAIAVTIACGGSTPAPDTQQTPTPQQAAQNAAQAGQDIAKSLQQVGQTQTATPIDFERLGALLPEPAGWTRTAPTGKQISLGMSISYAESTYEKGDSTIRLKITDSAFSQLALMPLSTMLMAGYNERSSEGYKKAVSIEGSPGFESWEIEPKEAQVTAVVGNRFIVEGHGRNVESVDVVRSFVQGVGLGKLAGLK